LVISYIKAKELKRLQVNMGEIERMLKAVIKSLENFNT